MARKYSKASQKKVEKVNEGAQGGNAAQRQFREEGHEPQASDCDRPIRGAPRGQQGPEEEGRLGQIHLPQGGRRAVC